eukprot:4174084-Pleurochrysis_carterae.AAC.1
MDEAARVRRFVERRVVGMSCCVGFRASVASNVARLSERRRRVSGDGDGQRAQTCVTGVQPVVHAGGGFGSGHDVDVVVSARGVNGKATGARGYGWCRRLRHACGDTPYVKAAFAVKGKNQTPPLGRRRKENGSYISEATLNR